MPSEQTEAREVALRPMREAPRGEYVLARYRQNDDERTEHYSGRWFVIRHQGKTVSDFDLGWSLFPGYGGVPDYCFDGWLPLPEARALPAEPASGEVDPDAKAAAELVEWWDTGILRDGAVRAEAAAIVARGHADGGNEVRMAEREITARIVRRAALGGEGRA